MMAFKHPVSCKVCIARTLHIYRQSINSYVSKRRIILQSQKQDHNYNICDQNTFELHSQAQLFFRASFIFHKREELN